MSLIINGMDMPYCCVVCPFKEMYNDGLLCKATKPHQYIPKFLHKRNEKCPLSELLTPHGRLIDTDKLVWFIDNHIASGKKWVEFETIKNMINSLPTIVEAEVK